jgi:tetratricopeptide (TPR) repeat protein
MSKKPLDVSTVYVILGLLLIAATGLRTISTPEIWTHLAQGQNNAPISFLESDSVINTTHLYDKLAYMAWNIGGAPLLIILNIAGLLGAFLLLLQVSKKWGGGLSQGYALLIVSHLIFQTLDVGPQVMMMLFIALFLYAITLVKSPAILFGALIPAQILWTNMHGSFLFGPVIVGLAAIQSGQQNKGAGRRNNHSIPSGTFGLLTVALLVATVVNPYFLKLHGQVLANIQSPAPVYWSSLFIEYFQIPALKPLILFVMVLGAGGLITLKKKLPVVLTTLAIFGAFLVWTTPQTSMLFSVLAFPFIVLSLTSISEYSSGSLSNVLGKQAKLLAPATGTVFTLLIVLSLIPIVSNSAFVTTGSASNFGLGIQENLYPDSAEALINHPDFPEKAINLPADGGYLAFKYGRKCFVDYRPGRYDKELLKNLNAMMLGNREAYDDLYDTYRPEAFIINTLAPSSAQGIVTLLSRDIWKLAYFDGTTAILIQNKEKFAGLLNNTDIQKTGLAQLEQARADYASDGGSCRAGNPAELIGSGKIFLAFNRPTEAKAIFSLLLQGNGRIPAAWIGLGNSQLLLKEFDAAVQSLKIATEQSPNSFLAWVGYATACKYAGLSDEHNQAIEKARDLAERNKKDEVEEPEVEEVEVKQQSLEEITIPSN